MPPGSRLVVVGVPRQDALSPVAALDDLFGTFLDDALPPSASGMRDPIYLVVHGWPRWLAVHHGVGLSGRQRCVAGGFRGVVADACAVGAGCPEPRDADDPEATQWRRVVAQVHDIAQQVATPGPGQRWRDRAVTLDGPSQAPMGPRVRSR